VTQSSHGSVALETPVQYVKGIGPRRSRLLARLDVHTAEDLLFFFPRRHVDRSRLVKIRNLRVGELCTVLGTIATTSMGPTRSGKKTFDLLLEDETGSITCRWFGQTYLAKTLKPKRRILVSGTVTFYGTKQFVQPEYEVLTGSEEQELIHTGRIVPIYPLTEGLTQKPLRRAVRYAVEQYLPELPETLPVSLRRHRGLLDLHEAISQYHFPDRMDMTHRARKRLAYEELFYLQLLLALRRHWAQTMMPGVPFKGGGELVDTFLSHLGFSLTGAQKRVLEEIRRDMAQPRAMHRLLHGDVGSGKTVIALAAMLLAVEHGYQSALMAPTEILAEQHYQVLRDMLSGMDVSVGLLTGGIKKRERKCALEQIRTGELQIVVGTHALIEEDVAFQRLGLAVVDEQHRFGVMQRARLRSKGKAPHLLVMTATPIPRTLSMTLYGDLDISVIDEMPPGRKPIVTRWVSASKRNRVYQFIREQVAQGRQCYVVYPLVEESEHVDLAAATEMYEHLNAKIFPDLRVALLHGQMRSPEKEDVMDRFRAGDTDVLVSTTVIEVGVDVPNATVMLIEHAERFGLAQLHQLRGRVGRGGERSYCILLSATPISQEARIRLATMQKTEDGFVIAEKDLELRGPGEFFGTRQHGYPELIVADLVHDSRLLAQAREDAFQVVRDDANLLKDEHKPIRENFERKYRDHLMHIGAG
jgi:ATP-dependent DNA helicase RecG